MIPTIASYSVAMAMVVGIKSQSYRIRAFKPFLTLKDIDEEHLKMKNDQFTEIRAAKKHQNCQKAERRIENLLRGDF